MKQWYVAVNGQQKGPFEQSFVIQNINSGQLSPSTLVWTQGFAEWTPISKVDELNQGTDLAVPPSPYQQNAHEIDYDIHGNEMQFVEIELDPGESVVAEAGAMMYMSNGIVMETIFGDGSQKTDSGGFMDKMLSAGKRVITGESLFTTAFTFNGSGKGHVAFAAPYPGKIIPLDLSNHNGKLVCQKDAFLCAAKGVSIGIEFQRKIGVALFGGEGFIMQKLEGDGLTFVHAGGTIIERELQAGEILRVDTGCLVALGQTVTYDIEFVGGIKSAVFGGEGFFFASLKGPGHVWLQSMPFSRLAGRIFEAAPQTLGPTQGEGSILGELGNIFQK
ncbi:MAG: TIGR00266 family protein [Deltaproteobacteria bacterium]|nr:MAG: TIGR00266 family protein [Deltaproteobacteria bacterium]